MMNTNTFATLVARFWTMNKRQTWTYLALMAFVLVWYASMLLGYPRVSFACIPPIGLILIYLVRISPKKTVSGEQENDHE